MIRRIAFLAVLIAFTALTIFVVIAEWRAGGYDGYAGSLVPGCIIGWALYMANHHDTRPTR